MSDSIETKGKTVDLAVSEALLQLGLRRDEVEIKVLEEPRAGLMGFIGARQAKVLVTKRRPTRGGRGGGRDRRDDDHRAHDLTADSSSGRGRGRGGRSGQGSQGGQGSQSGQGRGEGRAEPRNEGRGEGRGDSRGGRGGESRGEPRGDSRGGGRGRRDEAPRVAARDQAPRTPRPAGEERAAAPGQGDAQSEAQRSRRRRGGRGRGGRGRTGGGAPREDQLNGAGAVPFDEPNGLAGAVDAGDRPARREGGERSDRGDRGDRGGRGPREERGPREDRGGRNDRGGRGERPAREPDGNREIRFDSEVDGNVRGDEQPREEAMPRERAREERSRRDQHVTPAPAPVEPRFDDAEPVESAAAPEVIESPVIAPAVPRVKKKAWGGLGARRERPPVDKPLVPVQEPSPASIGAVYKPTKKAAARAAARAAEAEAFKNAPLTPPRSAPSRDQGYAGFSGNSGGGYGGRGGPEETIASGIAATDYAKPMAPVDDAGLPALLTELTNGMLARAGFPCECDTIPGEYHAVKVTADEDSAGMLIGRGGATAESIEHLVERMASNAAGDRVRMNLDINDYRIRREDSLREHAAEAIADVRAGNGPYHMEPMDARERRVVHLFAEPMPDITTYTVIGSGGKHVVIALNDGSQPDEGGSQEGGED